MPRNTIPKILWGDGSVTGESLGTGDGVATTFSGTLAQPQVQTGSLAITAGGQSVTDDGAGSLTGSGSGTINYVTGAYSVTFNAAPGTGVAVTAAYKYLRNTLSFGYPLDSAVSYPEPREGSEWAQAPSGVEDAWDGGADELLEGDARWIPTVNTTDPVATGWDGAAGWAAFLTWARKKNALRLYPDRDSASFVDCYLVEPMQGAPSTEDDGSRALRLKLRSTDGSAFTGY